MSSPTNKSSSLLASGNVNSHRTLAAACGNGIAGVLVFSVLPVLLGGFSEELSLTDLETGALGSTYFGLFALVSLTSIVWIKRLNWRRLSTAGMLLMLAGLALCRSVPNYEGALWGLALAGIGAAILYPISFSMIACRTHKDRDYAIKIIPEQLVPGILLFVIAVFFTEHFSALNFLLILMAILALPALLTLWMPKSNPTVEAANDTDVKSSNRLYVIAGLLALNLYFMGFAGLWAFLELLGSESQLPEDTVGMLLALGLVTSAIGPFLAAYIGDKYGRSLPLIIATIGTLVPLLLTLGGITSFKFGLMLAMLPCAYYFGISYIFGIIADADSSGKYASLMPFSLAVGAALGPSLFALFKTWNGLAGAYGFIAVSIVSGVIVAIALNNKMHHSGHSSNNTATGEAS